MTWGLQFLFRVSGRAGVDTIQLAEILLVLVHPGRPLDFNLKTGLKKITSAITVLGATSNLGSVSLIAGMIMKVSMHCKELNKVLY